MIEQKFQPPYWFKVVNEEVSGEFIINTGNNQLHIEISDNNPDYQGDSRSSMLLTLNKEDLEQLEILIKIMKQNG